MRSLLSSRLLSRETKTKLYIAYLRPIVMYACEIWATTKGNEQKLLIFEKKMYGPLLNLESGNYEREKNETIEKFTKMFNS